jgi:hypothetical protein
MGGQHPIGEWGDVTARYAGYARDYEGYPWQGMGRYGDPLYPGGTPMVMPSSPILQQMTQEKKVAAAQQAASDIHSLPGGKVGSPITTIIDGSTLFGNSAIVGALLVANTDVLINTYTVQVGYSVLLDNEDPEQMVMVRPYDSTTANAFIDCTVKIDVAKAASGDADTVYLGSTIFFRPDQNFSAGDRFRARWNKKYECKAGDLIRTFLRLNSTQAAVTVSAVVSKIGHVIRTWEILSG